ncbi:MAG TPA: 50S ribosomal protein L21 [Anaerolineales bacterium]|nr:50S ribosomal protein L21 [Anaerolineales bacterium]
MRFAIVESGGKQYRVVEGRAIEVDRLPVEAGKKFDLERILLMSDGDDVLVGTPLISDILVKVTVVDHVKGPKIDRFKYRPKKRIRVRGGHRQHYTRLMVDFIGKPDEERKAEAPKQAEAKKETDDLVKIEGIGPKVSKTLKDAGITTFEALANTSVEDIQKILSDAGLKMMDATSWPEQAKLAAAGDWDGLKAMQDELSGGRAASQAKKPAAKKSATTKKTDTKKK